MNGYVDRVEGNHILGWCAPLNSGSQSMVSARVGSVEIASVRADIERKDVEAAGICEANCGFELIVPLVAFDQYGLGFSITLERVEDGAVFAESVSVEGHGCSWTWSSSDLAMIVKKWRESSLEQREGIRMRLSSFDTADIITALMEYGFFEEVESALAAKASGEISESWLTLSAESCSNAQIERWALENRLKAAGARAQVALLEAEFMDHKVMPAFRDALACGIVEPSDWVALIDFFTVCPAATSLGDFFQRLIEFIVSKKTDNDLIITTCIRIGRVESVETASGEVAIRIRDGEIVSALCCVAIECLLRPPDEKNIDLESILRWIKKSTKRLPKQNRSTDKEVELSTDLHIWPSRNGVRWPQFRIPESEVSAQFSLLLFVGDKVLPQSCHDSVLSILNQASRGLRLLVIGKVERLQAKTREQLDQSEVVEVYFLQRDPQKNDLLREAVGQIAGDYVGCLEAGEIVGPGVLDLIIRIADQGRDKSGPDAIVFDTSTFAGARISSHHTASHLCVLSVERLSQIEENWLEQQFLSDGWFLVTPDIFASGVSLLPTFSGFDALQYALCFAAASRPIQHVEKIGIYRPLPMQAIEPLHTQEILQQAKQRSVVLQESLVSHEAREHFRGLLSKHFDSGVQRVTIMSSRLDKIFSLDTAREIREHFATLGYQADFVEEINPDQIVPGQLILILVHQYGAETDLIPLLAKRFPECPLIGWFWDNHHQALGNVEIARYFHACIAAHDFCRDVLISRRNVLLPSVPLCVTQWTTAEAKTLFAKHGHGERSKSIYGGFVRYATAARRNEFVKALQNRLDPHALTLVDEFNLAAYFALPAEERFRDWCRYRTSLCLPLYQHLSQRFFDALLCGQFPIVTDDIVDIANVVSDYPDLAKRFEILQGYDMNALECTLGDANRRFDYDWTISPREQHKCALDRHMFKDRLETILTISKEFTESLP